MDQLRRFSTFVYWMVMLAGVILQYFIVLKTGSVIVDGFQSIGAAADSSRSFDIHWPLLGNFMNYDQTWGFHWPGWPLLRSLLLPILHWNPRVELLLLCLLWASTALAIVRLSLRSSDMSMAGWVGALCLMAPGITVTMQSYRPEIVTALLLVLCLAHWFDRNWRARCIKCGCLVILPAMHPLGLVVPASWLAWQGLCVLRQEGWRRAVQVLALPVLVLTLGLLLAIAWFAFQPEAWEQFQCNVRSQRLLNEGLGVNYKSIFRLSYESRGSWPFLLLVIGALMGSALVLWKHLARRNGADQKVTMISLAAVGFICALFFNWAIKNPNTHHLVAVLPMAAWMYVCACQQMIPNRHGMIATMVLSSTLCLFNALPLKNCYLLIKNNGVSYRDTLRETLVSLPPSRKVFIPVVFWEAAQLEKRKGRAEYQFSTFPNILERVHRETYEQTVTEDLQTGDLLVWDPLQEAGGVFNFVEATALRHILIHPKDQSEWEQLESIRIPVRYSKNQPVDFEVYRKK